MNKSLKLILVIATCIILFFIVKAITGLLAAFAFEYFGLLNLENLGVNGIQGASAQDIASINRINGLKVLVAILVTGITFFFLKKKYLTK